MYDRRSQKFKYLNILLLKARYFCRLSNFAPVPVLSLAVPVLSLAAPLLSSVIVVAGQKNSVAAFCSLSLTMVKTGAKLQIPGIKEGLVLIKMAQMA